MQLVCNECRAVAATITREQFETGSVPMELRSEEVATPQCPRWGAMNVFPGFSAIEGSFVENAAKASVSNVRFNDGPAALEN